MFHHFSGSRYRTYVGVYVRSLTFEPPRPEQGKLRTIDQKVKEKTEKSNEKNITVKGNTSPPREDITHHMCYTAIYIERVRKRERG